MNSSKYLDSRVNYFIWALNGTKDCIYFSNLIMVPIGLVLNLITILIYSRKKFKKNTMGLYCCIIAFTDISALIVGFFEFFGLSINNDFNIVSEFSCKLLNYMTRLTFQMSAWLHVFLSLDRLISIKYLSKKLNPFKNRKFICLILVFLFIINCLLNMPSLYLHLIQTNQNITLFENLTIAYETVQCTSLSNVVLILRDSVTILFRIVLPFILTLVINILLIKSLIESKRKIKTEQSLKREHSFAITLIAMNIFFLINLLPLATTLIILFMIRYDNLKLVGATFAFAIAYYISILNNVMPFCIHLKFNRLFYKEFTFVLKNILNRIKPLKEARFN